MKTSSVLKRIQDIVNSERPEDDKLEKLIGFFPYTLHCPKCNGYDFTVTIGTICTVNENHEVHLHTFIESHLASRATCTGCGVTGTVEDFKIDG